MGSVCCWPVLLTIRCTRYIGLGALGLGGLYMVMRRRDGGTMKGAAQSADLSAKKPLENKAEKMIGRGG